MVKYHLSSNALISMEQQGWVRNKYIYLRYMRSFFYTIGMILHSNCAVSLALKLASCALVHWVICNHDLDHSRLKTLQEIFTNPTLNNLNAHISMQDPILWLWCCSKSICSMVYYKLLLRIMVKRLSEGSSSMESPFTRCLTRAEGDGEKCGGYSSIQFNF